MNKLSWLLGRCSAVSWAMSPKRTARRDPSRSTPRRVRRGSRRYAGVFFRHAIAAIYIHVLLLTSTKASPPPRPVASLWSTQGRVLAGVRFPED